MFIRFLPALTAAVLFFNGCVIEPSEEEKLEIVSFSVSPGAIDLMPEDTLKLKFSDKVELFEGVTVRAADGGEDPLWKSSLSPDGFTVLVFGLNDISGGEKTGFPYGRKIRLDLDSREIISEAGANLDKDTSAVFTVLSLLEDYHNTPLIISDTLPCGKAWYGGLSFSDTADLYFISECADTVEVTSADVYPFYFSIVASEDSSLIISEKFSEGLSKKYGSLPDSAYVLFSMWRCVSFPDSFSVTPDRVPDGKYVINIGD
ncbi:MAG: hypothetical protein ACLFQK_06725 [Fibrobacterota bacterium]